MGEASQGPRFADEGPKGRPNAPTPQAPLPAPRGPDPLRAGAQTPFQTLAADLNALPLPGSREAGTEAFRIERDGAAIEALLSYGASTCLIFRGEQDEAPPSTSAHRKSAQMRARARLVYPTMLIRRVTPLDRINTLLALRYEVRTGDETFDRGVTIEGDVADEAIAQAFQSKAARDAALDLINAGFSIHLGERVVRAEFQSPPDTLFNRTTISSLLNALALLVSHIPRLDPNAFDKRPQTNRLLTATIVVIGAIGALALAPGTLDDAAIVLRFVPRPLVSLPSMIPGIGIGIGLFIPAYFILRFLIKRRNSSTDLPLVLALFVVLVTLGVGGLDGGNRLLDDEPLAVHNAKVIARDSGKSRKSGAVSEWILAVRSWQPDAKEIELLVTPDLFNETKTGDTLRVTVHPGFFGWQWGATVDRAIDPEDEPSAAPP